MMVTYTVVPEAFKNHKFVESDIMVPLEDRPVVPKEQTAKDAKKMRQFRRKLRRYRIYNHETKQFEIS